MLSALGDNGSKGNSPEWGNGGVEGGVLKKPCDGLSYHLCVQLEKEVSTGWG